MISFVGKVVGMQLDLVFRNTVRREYSKGRQKVKKTTKGDKADSRQPGPGYTATQDETHKKNRHTFISSNAGDATCPPSTHNTSILEKIKQHKNMEVVLHFYA